jgi:hemerythrin-like metal-binding protein
MEDVHVTILVWNPEWETGIWKIDQQHRELLGQIEGLMSAIHSNEAETRIPGLLAFLAGYVDQHFKDEEVEMEASAYPGMAGHRVIHDQMRGQVAGLLEYYQADPSVITDEVLDFLTSWLINHINGEDRRMAHHLVRWASAHAKDRA